MFNRTSSFRFVVIGLAFITLFAITAAANWGGVFAALNFFAPAETSVPLDKAPFAPTVTATVGIGGTYATLKAAFDDINAGAGGLTGAVLLNVVGDTAETASAVLNASGTGSASYTAVVINPSGGAARTITGAITAGSPLIDLNGADNVTIDGLNTGGNSLTISNTTSPGSSGKSTIRFIGGATNNTITNSTILGSKGTSVATNGANITFSTDAVTANGNDNNTISNNNIGPAGANLSTTGIQCNGSTSTTAIGNSGIVINNNNIFDFFGAAVTSAGIAFNGGCNGDSITNNRFYQTGTRTWTTGTLHTPILMNSSTSTSGVQGMTITGNTIGYSSNTQTGTYALTGSTGSFRGISFSGITGGTVSNINNNTIASVSLTGVTSSGTSTSTPFAGILVTNGLTNTNTNTIGSQSATGSLVFSTNITTSTDVMGIYNFSLDDFNATGNNIGGISVTNAAASGTFIVYGLRANTSTSKAFNGTSNIVGGSIANSIQLSSTGTASQVIGMHTANAAANWTSNTVRNIVNDNGTGTTSSASVIGLATTTTTPNHTLSQNTVNNLSNSNTTAATVVTGIQFTGGTANVVERNFIHTLSSSTNSTSAEINGIRVAGGTTIYRNNMIAFGLGVANAIGGVASNSSTSGINGINGSLGTDSFFHNSVLIRGTATSGSGASYAFNGTQTVNTRSFRDNIFFNARTNSGATGTNYAIKINGTAANPTGLTINNNVYFANGTGGVFGYFNSLDVANIAAWRTAIGQDAGSFEANPQFVDIVSAVPDLHLNPTIATVAEGNGVDVGVVNDFDGQTRASFTPVDIGADAGNFNGVDLSPPAMNYTALGNTSLTTNRTLAVTITDVTGTATGGNAPRVYFNKNGGLYSSTACSLSSGTVQNGSWNCIIDNSLIGGVVATDVVRYFTVAQDTLGNLGANPSGGFAGTNVNTVTTLPTTPSSYTIVTAISGTKTLCASGCDYASLTGAGGVFADINAKVLTANLNIEIGSDLITAEDGSVALNAINEEPTGSNFTVKIYPTGVARAITSTTLPAGGFIRLNAADRVTIDGSIGGTGTDRSLTITEANTGTSTAVVWLQSNATDGATSNTIKNLNIVGQANTTTLIGIGMGSSTISTSSLGSNNNNNTVQNNNISKAQYGIYSQGAATVSKNTGNSIANNLMNTASPNNIRQGGILVGFEDGISISGNVIDGVSYSSDCFGIAVGLPSIATSTNTGNEVTNAIVSKNKIGIVSNTGGFGAAGITLASAASGTTTISNNVVTGVGGTATPSDFNSGIILGGGTGSTTRVYYNSVSMSGTFASGSSPIFAISVIASNPVVDIRNNAFYNTQTTTSGKKYAIGLGYPAPYSNLTINNNDYFTSTLGTAGSFATSATSTSVATQVDAITLAAFTAATSGSIGNDASSISSDPLFNSATNLQPQSGSPVLAAGTPIAGVTTDITGAVRSGSTPSIGAYETGIDTAGPVITYTALGNTTSLSGQTLSATITDASGVNTTAGTKPRIYYKRSTANNAFVGNTSADNGWKYVEATNAASPFSFTIDYSTIYLGPPVTGDTIQYFVVAQDLAGTPNVGINSGTFALAPTSVNLAAAQAPIGGAINSYLISTAVTGALNVGTAETFTSLTNNDAGGIFRYLNNNVITGNVTINITSDLTAETGTVGLNAFSPGFTVTIKPSGAARVVSGSAASNALVRTIGASNFTIDGSLAGGSDRSLTISNTNVTSPQVVRFGSVGTTASTNNTLKNTIISNGINTSSAVVIAGNDGLAGYFNNVTVQNNDIRNAFIGVFANAAVTGTNGSGTVFTQNKVDNTGTDAVLNTGLYLQGVNGGTVSNNTVGNFVNTDTASADTGIWMATGTSNVTVSGNSVSTLGNPTVTSSVGAFGIRESSGLVSSGNVIRQNTISNIVHFASASISGVAVSAGGVTVERNNISNIRNSSTSTFGAFGIDIQSGDNSVIKNNFVSGISGDMTGGVAFSSSFGVFGIRIGAGINHKIYNNSVNLSGLRTGTATSSLLTAGLVVAATTSTGLDIRNNIFANNITGGTTGIANVAVALPSGGSAAMNLISNNNSYYYGADAASGAGNQSFTASSPNLGTLALYSGYSSTLGNATNDNLSLASSGAVPYTSATDLHITTLSPEANVGLTLASVTNDYDNEPRPAGTAAEIGADELTDTTLPDTTLLTFPANPSNSSSATFTFSGTDSVIAVVASFECQIDAGGYSACTSPKNYTGLSQGSHTFKVRTKDSAGNVDATPATYTWSVDAIAPDTQILSTPPNPSNTTSPTFTFSGTDSVIATVASFECSVDADPFTTCTSPYTPTGLLNGVRLFRVRAIDAAGNVDPTPASYSWTIDTIPPDTSILTQPTNPTNSTSATFTYSSTGFASSVSVSFECKLDAAAFASCLSTGVTYTSLADGSHTFQVRSTDQAGNTDLTPATYTWTVDATAPDTAINTNPTNPSNSASAAFTFSGTDVGGTGVASFECKLDAGAYAACTSPANYTSLGEGSHTFQVRAIDNTGNTDATPASYTWVVDTVAPDTSILTNPTNPSNSASAAFTFSGTDVGGSGVASFECKLDAGAYAACTSPANYTSLSQGLHTFSVRAIDAAGNTDATPATFTWTVDAIAPDTQILTTPTNPSASASATFTFTGTDTLQKATPILLTFECKLDAAVFATCTSPANYTSLSQGSHTFSVRAKDVAGNTDATPATYTWTVDAIAPDTSIGTTPTDPSTSSSATFTFSGTDSVIAVVASFQCQIDGGGFTACTSPKNYTGLAAGSHTFQVRAVDGAGNVDPSPASFTWTINLGPTGPVTVTATAGTAGPTDYATLKAAFDAINAGTHQGVITVVISGDTTEAAAASLNDGATLPAAFTSVSIKPTGGAARTISGNVSGHLVDLNGADNVTIDGLNTGGNSLTITNTSPQVGASTVRFANDASNNTLTNSTITGSSGAVLSSGFGVVYFGPATTTGNNNNTVSNNNITASSGGQPINGILSQNFTAATTNSGNIVSGNSISDFYNTNSVSTGINVNSGNSGWTISNNKLFQTATRTFTSGTTHSGIAVTSGSGYTVTGNTVGFGAANGTGVYTINGLVANRFIGISLAVGTTADTSVQGNTVAGINLTTTSGASTGNGVLCGVSVTSGNVNIGNLVGNTFGSTSGLDSLVATPSTTQGAVVGINTATPGAVVISNNTFGGFTSSSLTGSVAGAVFGVYASGTPTSLTITNNTIGNSTAENMRAGINGTTTGSSIGGGVLMNGTVPATYNLSNNTIRNFSTYGTGTTGYVRGIQTGTTGAIAQVGTISNNTITNLITSGATSGQSSGNSSAQGIQFLAGINSTISGNTIANISNINSGTVGTVVVGIGHASGTNTLISNNKIYGLANASTTTSATLPNVIAGILIRSGTTAVTVQNNMISLGNGQATNSYIFGIWGNHGSTPDPLDKVYFNTVNIEGTVTSGAAPSAGFHRGDLTTTNKTPAVDVRNNIFVNNRSGGTGKHYAIANHIGGTSSTATGWTTVNNNALVANAATVGFWTSDQTFAGWKAASGGDSLSYSGIAVNFVNSVSDLHLNMGVTPTALESGGVTIAGITTDIDGQTRPGPAGSTNGGAFAPDLGADEFDGVVIDISAPQITYTAFTNTAVTTNRTLSVGLVDYTGVAAAANSPRIYFKKGTDAVYVSTACTIASGTPQNGTWNCVIDYSLVGGGAANAGDQFQYFVVAQDTLGNLGSNPSNGFTGTSVNNVTSPPTSPNTYYIPGNYSGSYNVGTGGAFTSLTNSGGIFDAINNGTVSGNVTINVVSDLAGETGAVALNEFASPFTLILKPSGAARSITGSAATSLIKLFGADRVTIDGSLSGGTDRSLTISNTAAGTIIWIATNATSGATSDTVKNSNLIGAGVTIGTQGIIAGSGATFGGAAEFPQDNNTIQNNLIKGVQNAAFISGNAVTLDNNWQIVGNDAGSAVVVEKLSFRGFLIGNAQNFQISRNNISGINSSTATSSTMSGIMVTSAINGGTITRNVIKDIRQNNTSGWGSNGILLSATTTASNLTVSNNFVSDIASIGFAGATATDNGYGVMITTGGGYNIYHNTVVMNTNQTAVGSITAAVNIAAAAATVGSIDLRDNILANSQTIGTRYAVYDASTAGNTVFSSINYNDYFSNQNVGFLTSARVTLADWQTATAQDANSLAVDPLFVSATDFHIQGTSTMINAGFNVGVTVDIDGDTRPSGSAPDIGADEIDQVAPDTQILTNPTNPSTSSSATFTFTGTDAYASVVASFECKLDAGAFAACTSPANYTMLGQGTHNFQVRAKDGAGNVDPTPASYTWFVDAIAPDTQILTNPTDPSNTGNATFTFSGTDMLLGVPALTFECKLDAGAFAACTSPKSYTGLADGSHTFQVRAKDSAGNLDPTPATFTWNIVTAFTGPVTITATAGTAGPTDYPTLQAAFDAINAGTHQGAVNVNVVTNTTETAPAVLNSSGAGSALYTSVLVRPVNDNVTVSGATATGRGLVELNGADNVTIDGDNPNTAGTNRNLTFTNTAANTVTFTSVIRIAVATTIVTSADNDAIKNVNVIGNATGRNNSAATSTTGTENTVFGIFAGPGASTVSATTAPSAITSVSTSVAAGATANNLTISNNTVVTAARGVSVNGSATTVFPGLLINNNVIGNVTAGAADQVTSIGITAQGSANGVISGNTVWVEGFVSSSAATHGINVGVNSATGTFTIDSNKVNRVRNSNGNSWSAFGINLGGGSNHIVQNNFVSGVINDQTAGTGAFSATFGAFGIRVASGTGHKIYHNSVNLYGPMGGIVSTDLTAAFGISSNTLTGIDVRNNIFANTITGGNPAGTRHVAMFLPSAATVTMNLTDNNNAYFVGTDPNGRLAQVGTTFGTGEYQASAFDPTATVPAGNFRSYTSTLSAAGTNDNASFASTALAPFTSATNLHIPNATATPIESAGAAVGVLTDIDGDTRPNGTAPDLGADEFAGVPPPANDIAAASIVSPVNASTIPTGTTPTPQATFTNVGSATQTNVGVSFTISGPGGYTYTNPQIIATIAPFQSVTVTFAAAPTLTTPGAYTMSASVTTPDSNGANNTVNGGFNAAAPLSGVYTVGGGGNYPSLTNPGGLFEQLNLLGATANVTANITSDLTGETGAVALNQLPGGFGLTIKPSGAARTISGNGAALGMIRLFGADNVTIDGSLTGGTDRSLTITYGNAGGTVIWIGAASAANGASGNTVKNCIISGNAGTTIIAGILAGSGTTLGSAAEAQNNNNTVQNNAIYRVQNSMFLSGATTFDQNWSIVGNAMGSTVAADKNLFRGMLLSAAQNFVINGNTISGVQSTPTTTAAMSGIQLAGTLNGGFVVNNTIRDIKNVSATGTGAFGMQIGATSAPANVTIANNFVSDITGLGSATVTSNGFGLNFNGIGSAGYKVYNNTVNMNTNQGSGTTAALYVGTGVTAAGALDIQNNIFANTQTAGATRYAVYAAGASGVFSPINYNDYFAQNVGFVNSATQATLANWQTATTQDANSQAVDPLFVVGDLHLAALSPMINTGVTLAAVTTDIDGQTRPIGAAYDIGADEWVAGVSISGRLTTPSGQGIKNVKVSLSDGGLPVPMVAVTGPFGYYQFDNVPTGATYTISITAKRFVFTPSFRSVTPFTNSVNNDFISDPLP